VSSSENSLIAHIVATRVTGARWHLRGNLDVLLALARSDLRVRYGRGPVRLLKWVLDPFALVGVYLLLVTLVLDREWAAPGLSLACAVVPFQLVMMTVIAAMNAIPLRAPIILNMPFQRTLIPVSSVLTETAAFGASLLLLALMMTVYGVVPTAAMFWLPAVMATNLVLAIGFAYPASLFGLWFPDLRPFAVSFVRTLFFLAPGLVPLAAVSGRANELVRLNPLSGLFESYRDVLLYGHAPAAWQMLYPLAVAVVMLAVFVAVYRREEPHFAKVLG
jgi:lipopolysaccharide transport system permease protein